MKKYFTSALLLGVLFSLSTVSAQVSGVMSIAPVIDTVAEQVDCTALRYPLSLGSRDSRTAGDVTNLQVYLAQTGYLETDPTGYFGNATKKAVQVFQRANGIAPQGNVGPATRAKIKELSCNGSVVQQPVPTTPTNPVMCTMEMVQCPDGSYSGRSGPRCETNCSTKNFPTVSSSTPTIGFLSTPTLRLRYDSTSRESTLYGQATIRITAGNTPVETNGIVSMLRFFNNGALAPYSNGTVPSLLSSSLGSGTVIPANTSATFTIAIQAPTKEIFAGSYTVGSVLHTVTSQYTPISNPILITGETPRTVVEVSSYPPVTVIGETSPYISNITCDSTPNINCGISGSRFDPVSNTVTIGGITRQIKSTSYSWTSSTYISFQMTEFGITQPGTYSAQVTTKEGASNTFGFTSTGVNQPANKIITVFGVKDPNLVTGVTEIVWSTSKPVNIALDMSCSFDAFTLTTDRGSQPSCGGKNGIGSWYGQSNGSVVVTPSGNNIPVTATFTATVLDQNGNYTNDKATFSLTFPATSQNNANNSIVISSATIKEISPTQINVDLTGTGFKKAVAMYVNNCLSGSALSFSSNSDIMTGTGYASNYFPQCATSGSNARVYLKDANGVSSNVMSIYVPYFNFAQTATTTATISASPTSVTSGQTTTVSWSSTNAAYCTVTTGSFDDYGPGSAPLTGSKVVGPLTASRTATITCPGKNGTIATQSVTIPVTTTPISVSASLLSSSPVSQLVVGNSTFLIANYNLSVQGSAGILRSLTLTTTGTDAIESVTVNGITAPVIMNKAVLSGLSSAISTGGLNLSVIVKFAGIMNSTTGGMLTSGVPNVGVTLTSAEITPSSIVSGVILNTTGSVVVTPLNVSSNKMTLVASKPSVTIPTISVSSPFTLGQENKIGEFTVSADANGSVRVGGVTLNVSSSNIQNLQISSFRVTDSVTTITSSAVSMFGNSITIGFNNNLYQIPPGRPVTFSVYGTVSGTVQNVSVPMYLGTSLAPSGFYWTDIVGGNMAYNGTNVYNFPTNSYSRIGMGTAPAPVVTVPAPTATISASPSSVTSGQSTTVSWSATNVNYCTVTTGSFDDYGAGAAPLTGSKSVGPLTSPRTVTITCPGKNGTTATQTITIPVTAPVVTIPAPTISIGATPSSVTSGQSTTVSWTALNVNYCTVTSGSINDYGPGSAPLVGSLVVGPLTSPRTVTITCPGKNGTTATQSVTIPVTAPTLAPVTATQLMVPNSLQPVGTIGTPYQPTTLTYTYMSLDYAGMPTGVQVASNPSEARTWSVTSGSLPAGLSLSSSGIISGTPTSNAVTSTFTVTVTANGRSASGSKNIIINQPGVVITTGYASCGTSNGAVLPSAPSTNLCSLGSATPVSGSGPWSWTCVSLNTAQSSACSANKVVTQTVALAPTIPVVATPVPAPTISILASPASVTSGQSTTVSWSALNVNYCTVTTGSINDYGPSSAPLVGSLVVGPLTSPRIATITCPGKNGTTATSTVTIPVVAPTLVPVPTGGSNKSTFKMNVLGAFASNVSCTDIPRNLIRGSESSYVTLLQDFLYNNGFLNETSTGFYGDKTVEAVKDYQATRGLPTTGMVYDFTRQAIFTDTCQ